MDITNFVVAHRNDALLVGDYGSYRAQLSRRLRMLRRSLGRATPKGKKYTPKAPVTAEDVAKNPAHIHLLLLTAERAWAHAMYMKSMHAADSSEKAITGSTKKHIVSRLRRAEGEATSLVTLLQETRGDGSSPTALLEARAYHSMLQGSLYFEAQKWERSLNAYSEAYCAYRALSKNSAGSRGDSYQELLSSSIEPSIRYAAYQLRLPRTLSVPSVAARYVKKNSTIVKEALSIDPSALEVSPSLAKQDRDIESKDVPRTITWRKRTVNLEDATVAQALALANSGQQQLAEALADPNLEREQRAAAFDSVLNPSQDAVDATVTAISELTADGVAQGDARMQALQITRTAVNYALVGWRVGRNRVLCGRADGSHIESEVKRRKKSQDGSKKFIERVEEQSMNKKLAHLRERVTLLDSTLQSLDSIRELPGVAADADLLKELASRRAYFGALRCLNVAHGHALLSAYPEALALYARAFEMAKTVTPDDSPSSKAPNLEISQQQSAFLTSHLQSLTHQHQALTQLTNDSAKSTASAHQGSPWVEHLHEYPASGAVDLTRLVDYPPHLRPVPVKPLFLDLVWDYVDYPGRGSAVPSKTVTKAVDGVKDTIAPGDSAKTSDGKRGWFGFGRS